MPLANQHRSDFERKLLDKQKLENDRIRFGLIDDREEFAAKMRRFREEQGRMNLFLSGKMSPDEVLSEMETNLRRLDRNTMLSQNEHANMKKEMDEMEREMAKIKKQRLALKEEMHLIRADHRQMAELVGKATQAREKADSRVEKVSTDERKTTSLTKEADRERSAVAKEMKEIELQKQDVLRKMRATLQARENLQNDRQRLLTEQKKIAEEKSNLKAALGQFERRSDGTYSIYQVFDNTETKILTSKEDFEAERQRLRSSQLKLLSLREPMIKKQRKAKADVKMLKQIKTEARQQLLRFDAKRKKDEAAYKQEWDALVKERAKYANEVKELKEGYEKVQAKRAEFAKTKESWTQQRSKMSPVLADFAEKEGRVTHSKTRNSEEYEAMKKLAEDLKTEEQYYQDMFDGKQLALLTEALSCIGLSSPTSDEKASKKHVGPLLQATHATQRVARGPRKALLIMDMQNEYLEQPHPTSRLAVECGEEFVQSVNAFREAAEDLFDVFILTQDWYPPDHKQFYSNHLQNPEAAIFEEIEVDGRQQILLPEHCIARSRGAQFHPELLRGRREVVVKKGVDAKYSVKSSFFDECGGTYGLEKALVENKISDVYICGMSNDWCLERTALHSAERGFNTFVVTDLVKRVGFGVRAKPENPIGLPGYYGATETTADDCLKKICVVLPTTVPPGKDAANLQESDQALDEHEVKWQRLKQILENEISAPRKFPLTFNRQKKAEFNSPLQVIVFATALSSAREIKEYIANVENVPVRRISIICKGVELEDFNTLESYGISEACTGLYIVRN